MPRSLEPALVALRVAKLILPLVKPPAKHLRGVHHVTRDGREFYLKGEAKDEGIQLTLRIYTGGGLGHLDGSTPELQSEHTLQIMPAYVHLSTLANAEESAAREFAGVLNEGHHEEEAQTHLDTVWGEEFDKI